MPENGKKSTPMRNGDRSAPTSSAGQTEGQVSHFPISPRTGSLDSLQPAYVAVRLSLQPRLEITGQDFK